MRLDQSVASLFARGPWGGRCFEVAARLVTEDDHDDRTPLLAHGWPVRSPTGRRSRHGWVECAGLVYDLTIMPTPFPREFFYTIGRIHEPDVKRYTPTEARDAMLASLHYGPWLVDPIGQRRPVDIEKEAYRERRRRSRL